MHPENAPSYEPVCHETTVLVVENEPIVRRFLRRTLEAQDFRVEEALDGEGALALIQAREEPFDLVLTDLSMPGIDGLQVSETLARYRPTVPVLCMSADPGAVPPIESSHTPLRVMLKPFTPEALNRAIWETISHAADLVTLAEHEIAVAHAGLSMMASALQESRTLRAASHDLVRAARDLRSSERPAPSPNAAVSLQPPLP